MNAQPQHTAILLFARSVKAEAAAREWSKKTRANQRVARVLLQQTQQVARQSGFDMIHLSEQEQCGDSFGQRLQNAFQHVYARGYQRVVAIGSDCANLTPDLLREAAQRSTPVLGPAADGGIYLAALSQSQFESIDFATIEWCTSSVFDELVGQLAGERTVLLPELADADHLHDLQSIATAPLSWTQAIKQVLASLADVTIWSPPVQLKPVPIRARTHRGPPCGS